jgi:hypothetical protein
MKAIFPQSIDGDLLNLVHLSNGFRMLDGASPLHVGDVVTTEAKIASVINTDAGKAVKVIGNIIHEGSPSSKSPLPSFTAAALRITKTPFEIVQEPDYVVEYPTDASIGVLLSKEWFELRDQSKPLTAGTSLIFRLKSEITFKSKVPITRSPFLEMSTFVIRSSGSSRLAMWTLSRRIATETQSSHTFNATEPLRAPLPTSPTMDIP